MFRGTKSAMRPDLSWLHELTPKGSSALWVDLRGEQQSAAQQVELGASVHLPLEQLELVDVALVGCSNLSAICSVLARGRHGCASPAGGKPSRLGADSTVNLTFSIHVQFASVGSKGVAKRRFRVAKTITRFLNFAAFFMV